MVTSQMKTGESLTLAFWFKDNYQLPDTTNMLIYLGGVLLGDLIGRVPIIERVGIYYVVRMSSEEQYMMRGYRDVIVVLDDPTTFGVIKKVVAGILFDKLADDFISTSENMGFNMIIELSIEENTIAGDAELLNALKGDKGNKGDQGDIGDKGDKGDTGNQGIQGEIGSQGEKGETGSTGVQGEQGIQGEKGDKGDSGVGSNEVYINSTEPTNPDIKVWYDTSENGNGIQKILIDGVWTEVHDDSKEDKGVAASLIAAIPAVDLSGKENVGVAQELFNGVDQSKWEQAPNISVTSITNGRLYNWYTTQDPRGIIPDGWHIPTDDEWKILIAYAGGNSVAGGKLKCTGTTYWNSPNTGTDNYGFNAIGSGVGYPGFFYNLKVLTNFIVSGGTSTEFYSYAIRNNNNNIGTTSNFSYTGVSIRLIKDNSVNEGDIIIDGDIYNTVTIGTQIWLKQNLSVIHYNNGDLISNDLSQTDGMVSSYNGNENNVHGTVVTLDLIHIQPKNSKRIHASIIDDLPVYVTEAELIGRINGVESDITGVNNTLSGEIAGINENIETLTETFTTDITGLNDGKVDKVANESLVLDTEIAKIHVQNTDYMLLSPDTTKSVSLDNAGVLTVYQIAYTGTPVIVHAQEVYSTNDQIILRDGAVSGLANGAYAGFTAKLYDGVHDGQLVFDKDGFARVGDVGSLLKLAAIQETPTDAQFTYYDAATYSLKTRAFLSGDITGALGFTPYNTTNPSNFIPTTGNINNIDLGANTLTISKNININNANLVLNRVGSAPSITTTISETSGNLNGNYMYSVTYVTANGETYSGSLSASISPVNKQVNLTNIPISSDPAVIARKIYRNTTSNYAVPSVLLNLVTTINNNTDTTYVDNIADASLGVAVPRINTTGGNIYLGNQIIASTNDQTTYFGYNALQNSTGYADTAFGSAALAANTTGVRNSAFGLYSLTSNTTGNNNSAFGTHSLNYNTTGSNNTAFGFSSLMANTTANGNTAFGHLSLYVNTTGASNTSVGDYSLTANTTGASNTAVGYNALATNTTGNNNTALGFQSLYTNITGVSNTAVGYQALFFNTGSNNTALGLNSLSTNNSGYNNTASGTNSLNASTTGYSNTAFGYNSLYANNTGYQNTAIGATALTNIVGTNVNNVALGYNAGRFISDGVTPLTTPSMSTFIGTGTMASANGNTNEIVIGYNVTGNGTNTVTLGNSSIVKTVLQGVVMIKQATTASAPAYVKGGMYFDTTLNKLRVGGVTAWETVASV